MSSETEHATDSGDLVYDDIELDIDIDGDNSPETDTDPTEPPAEVLALQDNLQATIQELADAMDAENLQRQMLSQAAQRDPTDQALDIEMSPAADTAEPPASTEFASHEEATATVTGSEVSDNMSLDELLAALNISNTAQPGAVADATAVGANDLPTQVPRIEELWQELGGVWPVITHHPDVANNIEELWSRLKEAHRTGILNSELSELYHTLADDHTDITDNPRPASAPLRNSDEVADIVSRILAGVKTRDIVNDDSADTPTAESPAKQGSEEFDVDKFLQGYAGDSESAVMAAAADADAENHQDTTADKLTISTEELSILEKILGDRLDRNAVGAPAQDNITDLPGTGENLEQGPQAIPARSKPTATASTATQDMERSATGSPATDKISARKANKSKAADVAGKSRIERRPAPALVTATLSATDTDPAGDDDDDEEKTSWLPRTVAALVVVAIAWLWLSSDFAPDRAATELATLESTNSMTPNRLTDAEDQRTIADMKAKYRRAAEEEHARVIGAAAERASVPDKGRSIAQDAVAANENMQTKGRAAIDTVGQISGATGGDSASAVSDYRPAVPIAQGPAASALAATPAPSSELSQKTAYNTLTETLNVSTRNIQNLVDGSLDRLRASTQTGLLDLSQRVNRLEDAIGKLQAAIESLLRQNTEAQSDQNRRLQALGERLDGLETAQKKAFNARIERDKEGVTIVLTEPRNGRTGASGTDGTYDVIVHTVVKGDTLWDIAAKYINDPFRYPELARLSKIKNPDRIFPGDRVRIVRRYVNEP